MNGFMPKQGGYSAPAPHGQQQYYHAQPSYQRNLTYPNSLAYTQQQHSVQHHASSSPPQQQQPASYPPLGQAGFGDAEEENRLTYRGQIKTSADAILLLAACDLAWDASAISSFGASQADDTMHTSPPPRRISRRLLENERADLIKSGSVFVWDEQEAGMRRWTDGRCWSASRVSGCFLTYRELEVRKRSSGDPNGPRSNRYKIEGLIKQSFSMTTNSGRKLHIVSYYTKRDLREGHLRRVSEDPRFVGEAGGEWGLQVDESEFPDPVTAAADGAQQHTNEQPSSSANASASPCNNESRSAVRGVQTVETSPEHQYKSNASPQGLFMAPSDGRSAVQQGSLAPTVNTQYASSAGMRQAVALSNVNSDNHGPLKRRLSDHDGDVVARSQQAAAPSRPPLKRLRSSSANDLPMIKSLLAPPQHQHQLLHLGSMNAVAPRRSSDDPRLAMSSNRSSAPTTSANRSQLLGGGSALTESNMRGAGHSPRKLSSTTTNTQGRYFSSTPGTSAAGGHLNVRRSTGVVASPSQQDSSAVGALLSLRGFSCFDGDSSRSSGGYKASTGESSLSTPLTTPFTPSTTPDGSLYHGGGSFAKGIFDKQQQLRPHANGVARGSISPSDQDNGGAIQASAACNSPAPRLERATSDRDLLSKLSVRL